MWRRCLPFVSKSRRQIQNCLVKAQVRRLALKVPRGENRARLQLEQGIVYNGFRVESVTPIPDFESTAYSMVHERTGAEYLHVDRADTNNVFGVLFRTRPENNCGVAHILEHTMLCGSEKYPIRDPFFNMIKRSLSTFMNAFTASDWVMLPFSTQNERDFQNLLAVYLDAAFFPNLKRLDFLQEGHRLEFTQPDEESPEEVLQIKGVVFNEMKGAMSDPFSFMQHRMQSLLFENNTYHFNSGGEPEDIPKLTYEALKEFHSRFFHPSNSRFFTYGDLPPSLEEIGEVCDRFSFVIPDSEIPLEARRSSETRVDESCPATPGEQEGKETKVCVSWMCSDITEDIHETFAMKIVSDLLLNGPSAPFYKSLIAPNIGTGYSPCTGYSSFTRQGTFGVGLVGISRDDVSRVEGIIHQTLEECVETGFEESRVEAVIHQMELSQRTVKANFGLGCLMRMAPGWIHGEDPLTAFQVNELIQRLRTNLENGPYFQNLIKKHILNNSHKVILSQSSDEVFLEELEEKEMKYIESVEAVLTPKDKDDLKAQAEALKENQEMEQDVDALPTLTIEDIPQRPEQVDLVRITSAGVKLFQSHQPTNGILYLRALFNLSSVPEDLVPYLSLYATCLSSTGAGDMDPASLSDEIKLNTGGISTDIDAMDSIWGFTGEKQKAHEFFLDISSCALSRNVGKMFDLLNKIMLKPNFRFKDRIESLLRERAQDDSNSLLEEGHEYAMMYASRDFSAASQLQERLGGLTQIEFFNELAKNCPDNIDELVTKLEKIHDCVTSSGLKRAFVSADKKTLNGDAEKCLDRFLGNFGACSTQESVKTVPLNPSNTFIALPAQVNFCARSIRTVPYTNEDAPALRVLAKLISLNFLHKEIREKGGAYGSGASQAGGKFSFFSYRDPETTRTIETFERAIKWAIAGEFADRDIDEALLSLFSDIDKPVAPSSKGQSEFAQGLTFELQKEHRSRLLSITRAKLIEVARKHLQVSGSLAIVGTTKDAGSFEALGWDVKRVSSEAATPSDVDEL